LFSDKRHAIVDGAFFEHSHNGPASILSRYVFRSNLFEFSVVEPDAGACRTLVDGDRARRAREVPHEHAVWTSRAAPSLGDVSARRMARGKRIEELSQPFCRRIERHLASIEPDAAASALTSINRHVLESDRGELGMAGRATHSVRVIG
jgi:hypothetical protein